MPKYNVCWTYNGEQGSEHFDLHKHAVDFIDELLFTGKRGALITIEVV